MNRSKLPRQSAEADLQGSELDPATGLGPNVNAKIGQQLRLMYGGVVSQGVPDRFVEILRGLDDPTDEGSKE